MPFQSNYPFKMQQQIIQPNNLFLELKTVLGAHLVVINVVPGSMVLQTRKETGVMVSIL